MDRLPIFLDLDGRDVLLLGTGPAADAKQRLIEGAGGRVVDSADSARLAFITLEGAEAEQAAERLKAAGLLVNVVDRPDLCDFLVPAIVDRSPVIVAIGTGGASATLAKVLRERLEALLPTSLGDLARSIADRRRSLAARLPRPDQRRRFWDRLLAPGGLLDPFADAANAADIIDGALEEEAAAPPRLERVALASDDPDDLTLRQLRWLSQADSLFHTADIPPAVLDRARRDAVRNLADSAPVELSPGLNVWVCRKGS